MINAEIQSRLEAAPVVPLIQADDPGVAVEVAHALVAGGLTVLEVVLRTDAALECMRHVVKSLPDAIVGAGTVLSAAQAKHSLDAGAAFIVSPGLHVPVVEAAQAGGVDMFPGVATAFSDSVPMLFLPLGHPRAQAQVFPISRGVDKF